MQPQDDSSPTRSNQDKKQKKEKEKPNTVRKDEQGEIADESEADEITTLSLFSHLRVSPTSTLSISADQLLRLEEYNKESARSLLATDIDPKAMSEINTNLLEMVQDGKAVLEFYLREGLGGGCGCDE